MIRSLAKSASSSVVVVTTRMQPVIERSQRAQTRCYEAIRRGNRRFGLPREEWLEIVQIALRVLAPLAAALLLVFLFPPVLVKVLVIPTVLATILLAALYGGPEKNGFDNGLDVHLEIPD